MNRRRLIFIAFILVALAQLFVPWHMISKQAGTAGTGAEFKFKTESEVRRGDNLAGSSLRGKFIWLHFAENHIKIADKKEWQENQSAYVMFTEDSAGFAKIKSVTKVKPEGSSDWVRARVYVNWKDSTLLQITYPFNEYYIEDTNHQAVDSVIKNGLNDSLKVNYLKVKIKDNQFMVSDLMIDGRPFKEIINGLRKTQ